MSALGEEFRNAREARSLSLSDVAERLHIRSVYLAAIEDEDWPVIGAPVYVRGFMRTYARFLGLDPEAVVARFAAIVPAEVPAPAAGSAEPIPGERSGPSLAGILAVVIAVLAVLFVGYEFYQYRAGTPVAGPAAPVTAGPEGTAAAVAAPSAAATDSMAAIAGAGTPAAAAAPAATPAAKRGLSLRVTETSWLRVTIDGNVAFEGTLTAGTAKSFTGRTADVRVGNAAGVSIAINGRPVGPLGGPGDVVERRFALSGE